MFLSFNISKVTLKLMSHNFFIATQSFMLTIHVSPPTLGTGTLACATSTQTGHFRAKRPNTIQFDTQSHHSSSKNVLKVNVLYLRDFL